MSPFLTFFYIGFILDGLTAMRRVDCLNKIITNAARFVYEVEGFNATSQYGINIHAENFLIPVLNEIFGLSLENLNASQKRNFPAIDLADFKNRVAFQITASTTTSKITDTLNTFFENNLHKQFDTLYFYLLTEKKEKYPDEKIQQLIPEGFSFNIGNHVYDKDTILQKIDGISATPKLELLAKIYEHEFSDVQIQLRKKNIESGLLNNEPEDLFPNMLEISFPRKLYIAELNIDEAAIIANVNEYLVEKSKRPIKSMRKDKLVRKALRKHDCKLADWILHENSLYTLRDLSVSNEPLSKIVDKGTITAIDCNEFYENSEAKQRVFKHLLGNTLTEYCGFRGIEWYNYKGVFRFANNQDAPMKKQIRWKGKNEATKTVIYEIFNKTAGHIICFRNLAFRAAFENFDGKWFLTINPTWSFTNPYGYRTSRFEPGYMSGLKLLENNGSVYNYFRFFGYHLTVTDLFAVDYPFLTIRRPFSLSMEPSFDEKVWKPVKEAKAKGALTEGLESDNELNKTLFD